jgi:uncharacterized protein YqgC (DUF456 family)
MTLLWWILSLLLVLTGFLGSFLPLLPGPPLILAGALLHRLALGPEHSVGVPTLCGLLFLAILSLLIDLLAGTVGARWFGASRWGALGGLIGTVAGLFLGLPGLIFGPVAGAFAGELLAGKGLLPAGKSTWGTVLGTTAGLVLRGVTALAMVLWFLIAVWV